MKHLDRSLSVAVIYNIVDDASRVDISSVVESVTELQNTLVALGHRVSLLRVDKGVGPLADALEALQPDVVFNLCEGYREWSAGEACIAGLLELLGIPYTGSEPVALGVAPSCSRSNGCHGTMPDFRIEERRPNGQERASSRDQRLVAGPAP